MLMSLSGKFVWTMVLVPLVIVAILAATFVSHLAAASTLQPVQQTRTASITGRVVDSNGPVAGAHVRVQLSDTLILSGQDGSFSVPAVSSRQPVTITAWSEGYYIAWTTAAPNGKPITITLTAHYQTD